jgi:vacuolar-type H+-ATPase subunit E/Vma4
MRRVPAVAVLAIVSCCAPAHAGGLPGGDPLQRLRAQESAQAASRNSSRRAGIVWVALGSGALLLVVLSAVQTKRPLRLARVGAQTPEGGAHMRRRLNEREETGAAQVQAPAPEPPEAGDGGFAELGRHVATVLETARKAAEKIESDARREASQMLERAKAEAAEIEADTAEKRSAAFAAAEDVRSRADAYAEKKQKEADEATAEALDRADREARERARAAEERQQALDSHVERTEERLQKLAAGLRELAGRVDELVGTDALDEALQRQVAQPAHGETGSNGQEA